MNFDREVENIVRAGFGTTSEIFDKISFWFKIGRERKSVLNRIRRSLKRNSILRRTNVVTGRGVKGNWRIKTMLEQYPMEQYPVLHILYEFLDDLPDILLAMACGATIMYLLMKLFNIPYYKSNQ
jgi:hypothetical protein